MPKRKPKDWRSLPRKPAAERRPRNLKLRLTDAEMAAVQAAAAAAEVTVSAYARRKLLTPPDRTG